MVIVKDISEAVPIIRENLKGSPWTIRRNLIRKKEELRMNKKIEVNGIEIKLEVKK